MAVTLADVRRRRWRNQHLARPFAGTPAELVRWFGAVQGQEYAPTMWGLAQRLRRGGRNIGDALDSGDVLRTHVMRPTWHLVPRDDIRWMLELTAPRIKRTLDYYGRTLGVTPAVLRKSGAVLRDALRGGRSLTREEVKATLRAAGLGKDLDLRFWRILGHHELDGLVCSGPTRGKQTTWALLEERAPRARSLAREEALATLTRRYFQSHGPATVQDCAWWSGLRMGDVRAGIEAIRDELVEEPLNGTAQWSMRGARRGSRGPPAMHLLPTYDEYVIAYKNRAAALDPREARRLTFTSLVAADGRAVGTWKLTTERTAARVEVRLFGAIDDGTESSLRDAFDRLETFLDAPVEPDLKTAKPRSQARAASLFGAGRLA